VQTCTCQAPDQTPASADTVRNVGTHSMHSCSGAARTCTGALLHLTVQWCHWCDTCQALAARSPCSTSPTCPPSDHLTVGHHVTTATSQQPPTSMHVAVDSSAMPAHTCNHNCQSACSCRWQGPYLHHAISAAVASPPNCCRSCCLVWRVQLWGRHWQDIPPHAS
jgi:hypothetical protein